MVYAVKKFNERITSFSRSYTVQKSNWHFYFGSSNLIGHFTDFTTKIPISGRKNWVKPATVQNITNKRCIKLSKRVLVTNQITIHTYINKSRLLTHCLSMQQFRAHFYYVYI